MPESGGLAALKAVAARWLDRDPRVSLAVYAVLVRCPWLLPHDPSYLGVQLIRDRLNGAGHAPGAAPLLLDIGANNGISSRGFLRLLPDWHVLAIEANPLHTTNLTWVQDRAQGRFQFVIGAASDGASSGEIRLFTPVWRGVRLHTAAATARDDAMATAAEVWRLRTTDITVVESVVPRMTVDSLRVEPTIVKIDAEGSEAAILRGMRETIARARPIVLMEATAQGADGAAAWLRALDYSPVAFDARHQRFHAAVGTATAQVTGSRNRYFFPSERRALSGL